MKCNRWIEAEDNLLINLYGKIRIEELIPQFPRHTQGSIYKRAKKLGLKGNQHLAQKKYSINQDFFSNGSVESCYWAGFIAADGHIAKDNGVTVALSAKDKNHLEKLIKSVDYNGSIEEGKAIRFNKEHSFVRVTFWGVPQWHKDLKEKFNITPKKSLTLQPPIGLTRHQELAFIIGYLDGDGTIYLSKDGKYNRFNLGFVGTKAMLEWIKRILNEECPHHCGLEDKIRLVNNYPSLTYSCLRAYMIAWKLLEIDCPFRMERKWSKVKQIA